MAYSTVDYTGDGTNRNFTVTFPYLLQAHVSVSLDDATTTAYTWTSSTVIQLTTAPSAGVAVRIARNTSRGTPLVDFVDASSLTEEQLDTAILQALYVAQEAFDTSGTSSADAAEASALAAAASATAAAASATAAAASATAAAGSAASAASVLASSGYRANCILRYVGTTQIRLDPYKGNSILVNGSYMTIPAVGTTLTNSGLSADTNYYIYAYNSSGTLTLEAVPNAPQISLTTGMMIKGADATRTLVGMVRMNSSGQFADNAAQRLVRSWFSDQGVSGTKTLASDTTFSSASLAELSSSMRIEFLAWEFERIDIRGFLVGKNGTAGSSISTQPAVTTVLSGIAAALNVPVNNYYSAIAAETTLAGTVSPAGYYYAQLYAASSVSGATALASSTGLVLETSGASA